MEKLNDIFPFENLEALLISKDYVMALYLSLHMLREYPDNVYLKCIIAHSLFELCVALSSNNYLEYVEFPDKTYPEGYNQLLTFLHNMNSGTLQKLFSYFIQENLRNVENNSYVNFLVVLQNKGNEILLDDVVNYEKENNEFYFSKLLKEKISLNTDK